MGKCGSSPEAWQNIHDLRSPPIFPKLLLCGLDNLHCHRSVDTPGPVKAGLEHPQPIFILGLIRRHRDDMYR